MWAFRALTSRPVSHLRRLPVTVRLCSASSDRFNKAVQSLNTLSEEPDNTVKLQLYALYKQATVGKCNAAKPGALDFVGKAKWTAWNDLGDMNKEDAQNKYAEIVEKLQGSAATASAKAEPKSTEMEGLAITRQKARLTLRFNRPDRKNSITLEMYREVIKVLNEAANDDSVNYLVLTGTGDYFSSGNDLGNFTRQLSTGGDIQKMAIDAAQLVREYVAAFIEFPKPIIACINGPAIGVSCTILGLVDVIFASDVAFFQTPFSKLGLSPEGCSSYTFPRIMGYAKASEVLMMNKALTAEEAKACGFVAEVFPKSKFEQECESRLAAFDAQPPRSLCYSKELIRQSVKDDLHAANNAECDRLEERFTSDEAMKAVQQFFAQKGKL